MQQIFSQQKNALLKVLRRLQQDNKRRRGRYVCISVCYMFECCVCLGKFNQKKLTFVRKHLSKNSLNKIHWKQSLNFLVFGETCLKFEFLNCRQIKYEKKLQQKISVSINYSIFWDIFWFLDMTTIGYVQINTDFFLNG